MQSALNALASIGGVGGSVSVSKSGAYMLTAQLATMELNVLCEGVSLSSMLYVGSLSALNTGVVRDRSCSQT